MKNIKEVNQILLTNKLNKLPLNSMGIEGFKKIAKDKELILENKNGKITLILIDGSKLYNYVIKDEVKELILNLFEKIVKTEDEYYTDPIKLEEEVERYSEQLPHLYKKLEENYWVVTQATNDTVISEFIVTVNNETNKLTKTKTKII